MDDKNIKSELVGSDAFRMIRLTLSPGAEIITEPGAMASQDSNIEVRPCMNGNFLKALAAKFFGAESFFINTYKNQSNTDAILNLTQKTPGDIICYQMAGDKDLYLEGGAFIARTKDVRSSTVWAGFASFIAGEGLFRLKFSGQGRLWFGSYGAIVEKELVGDMIVDSGHLLAYPPDVKLSLKLSGNLFSSILSKEGFVLKLSGQGKVLLQSRSVKGLAQWLNARFWG